MEKIDYLQMKTTNVNIRISPLLKSSLIEKGASLGLTLSDFILHLITKGINTNEDELKVALSKLKASEQQAASKEKKLLEIESLFEPFKNLIGQQTVINGTDYLIEDWFDILTIMVQHYKFRKP